ncbi:MAG: tetratricopeptide repeat protein [Bacilli bacterium]|nr:tetratricopeptide repeat protein [Bacilli bacterium]
MKDILSAHYDLFIAYHGDDKTGTEGVAAEIYHALENHRINGKKINIFLNTITNKGGIYGQTPIVCKSLTSLFLLVANENIPVDSNGLLSQYGKNRLQREVYQEVDAFYNGPWQKDPKTSRIINCGDLGYEEAMKLHPIFMRKECFSIKRERENGFKGIIGWIDALLAEDVNDNEQEAPQPITKKTNSQANEESARLVVEPLPYYTSFISRKDIIKKMHEKLEEANFLIVSSDAKGSGKSTLAKNYARQYKDEFDDILFVNGVETIEGFITNLSFVNNSSLDNLDPEEQFEEKKKLFLKLNSKTLIVISDLDDYLKDKDFELVLRTQAKIIITSTTECKQYPNIKLPPMSDDDLLEVFRNYCSKPYSNEELIDFFNKVDRHILTITLAASYLDNTDDKLESVAKTMIRSDSSVYLDRTKDNKSINEHLLNILKISSKTLSKEELQILQILVYIDRVGVERKWLTSLFGFKLEQINSLSDKGLINIQNGIEAKVWMYAMVSELIYENFPIDFNVYEMAMTLLNKICEYDELDIDIQSHIYPAHHGAFVIEERDIRPSKSTIEFLINYSKHLLFLSDFDESLKSAEKAKEMILEAKDIDPVTILKVNECLLDFFGENLNGIKNGYDEAMKLVNQTLPFLDEDNDDEEYRFYSGCVYDDIGAIYRHAKTKDYSNSIANHENAMRIFGLLLEDFPGNKLYEKHYADTMHEIGSTAMQMGDAKTAIAFLTDALDIREKILDSNHPSLAKSYNTLGSAYNKLKSKTNYKKAIEFEKKALAIRTKIYPRNHYYIAKTYNNIASSYAGMKKNKEAIENYSLALDIAMSIKENSEGIYYSSSHLAKVYEDTKNYKLASKYYEIAYENSSFMKKEDRDALAEKIAYLFRYKLKDETSARKYE